MAGYRSFTALWLGGAGDMFVASPPTPPVLPPYPAPNRCYGRWSTEVLEMPAAAFPFERIMVDHVFRGTTRVWWRLDSSLTIPPPYTFRLEASYVGTPSALDWIPLTDDELNATYLTYDSTRELTGKNLFTTFRVIFKAGGKTFYSNAMPIWGTLTQGNWVIAREIIRKHKLHQRTTAADGYMLRRMRYGAIDPDAVDALTQAQITSSVKTSWGTPFKVGYHPPFDYSIEIDPRAVKETRGGANPAQYSGNPAAMTATAVAFPQIAMEDVWVNKHTDERWRVGEIKHLSTMQGVPLIIQFELFKVPHNSIVYSIPVDEWSLDPRDTEEDALPVTGDGCVTVDHDYPTNENMVYTTAECCAIEGATIRIFTQDDWVNGARLPQNAIASSITTTGGRWAYAVRLNPGEYVVQFVLDGQYGPDTISLTVAEPAEEDSVSSSENSSLDVSYGLF